MSQTLLEFTLLQLLVASLWLFIYRKIVKIKQELAIFLLSLHLITYVWLNVQNISNMRIEWAAGNGANGFGYEILALIYVGLFSGFLLLIWLIFHQRFGVKA